MISALQQRLSIFARVRSFFSECELRYRFAPGARGGTASLLSMLCAHKRNCLPADLLYSEHNFLSFFMVMTMMWQCHLSSSECRCYRLNGFSLFKRLPIPLSSGSRMLEQSVGEWLESIGLQQYESKLLLNGFDDVRFLVSARQGSWPPGNGLAKASHVADALCGRRAEPGSPARRDGLGWTEGVDEGYVGSLHLIQVLLVFLLKFW